MHIAIYSPYLDTVGGGEKYILTLAKVLAEDHRVDLLLDLHLQTLELEQLKLRIERIHGMDLSSLNFAKAPIGNGSKFLERMLYLRRFDYLFLVTDGSLFFASAKKNIIHFQVPFENKASRGIWGYIKQKSWNMAIYNSLFTKQLIEKNWAIRGQVIYPPVDVTSFKVLAKKKQILSVGRFHGTLKDKNHLLLINTFKDLAKDKKLVGWSLHLVGGTSGGAKEYVKEVKQLAKGANIFIHTDLPKNELIKFYGESSIYWHAKGFNESDPKAQEHFGITTVEAMAAGCVPVVINAGGLKEIVTEDENGYLWDSVEQLKKKTLELISNDRLRNKFSENAVNSAKRFSKEQFASKIKEIIKNES